MSWGEAPGDPLSQDPPTGREVMEDWSRGSDWMELVPSRVEEARAERPAEAQEPGYSGACWRGALPPSPDPAALPRTWRGPGV